MSPSTEEYVSKKSFEERSHLNRWLAGLLFGLMSVFLAMTVYALDASRRAEKESDDVLRLVERHIAAETEADKALKERLEQIQSDVRETRDLVVKMLQNRQSVKLAKEEKP